MSVRLDRPHSRFSAADRALGRAPPALAMQALNTVANLVRIAAGGFFDESGYSVPHDAKWGPGALLRPQNAKAET